MKSPHKSKKSELKEMARDVGEKWERRKRKDGKDHWI